MPSWKPPATSSPTASTGPSASASRPSCRCRAPRWTRSAGTRCDVILVTGDAYVDHPSFGMALVGRLLEAQGFRVGIIAQPDWQSAPNLSRARPPDPVLRRHRRQHGLDGQPLHRRPQHPPRRRLHARRRRPDKRPDRAVIVYAQRCREAFPDVPIVIGGIEASLRRIAHYDYWSDKVRRSVLLDAQGRPAGLRQRRAADRGDRAPPGRRRADRQMTDIRGTAFMRAAAPGGDWSSTRPTSTRRAADAPSRSVRDGGAEPERARRARPLPSRGRILSRSRPAASSTATRTVVRLPSFEAVQDDPVLYAHASRVMHLEIQPRQRARAGAARTATATCG